MGLIKAALITGAGIYGIKQLTKSRDHDSKNSKNNNNNYPPQGPQGQGYWGPPGQLPQGARQDAYHGENPNPQRQWYPAQEGPSRNQRALESSGDYEAGKRAQNSGGYASQTREIQCHHPPAYTAPQQGSQQWLGKN